MQKIKVLTMFLLGLRPSSSPCKWKSHMEMGTQPRSDGSPSLKENRILSYKYISLLSYANLCQGWGPVTHPQDSLKRNSSRLQPNNERNLCLPGWQRLQIIPDPFLLGVSDCQGCHAPVSHTQHHRP